jgi:hypothetical protein
LLDLQSLTGIKDTTRSIRDFFERFQTEGYGRRAFWRAVLRVAERILKDLDALAKSQTPRSPDT